MMTKTTTKINATMTTATDNNNFAKGTNYTARNTNYTNNAVNYVTKNTSHTANSVKTITGGSNMENISKITSQMFNAFNTINAVKTATQALQTAKNAQTAGAGTANTTQTAKAVNTTQASQKAPKSSKKEVKRTRVTKPSYATATTVKTAKYEDKAPAERMPVGKIITSSDIVRNQITNHINNMKDLLLDNLEGIPMEIIVNSAVNEVWEQVIKEIGGRRILRFNLCCNINQYPHETSDVYRYYERFTDIILNKNNDFIDFREIQNDSCKFMNYLDEVFEESLLNVDDIMFVKIRKIDRTEHYRLSVHIVDEMYWDFYMQIGCRSY